MLITQTGIGHSKQGTSTPTVSCKSTIVKSGFAGYCLTLNFHIPLHDTIILTLILEVQTSFH